MELSILTPMEKPLPEVQWNNAELKEAVKEKMKEFTSTVYTEVDSKAIKEDKAKINKFISAVEDERKKVKRYYIEPYEKFEAQAKEVLVPAREAVCVLDSKLQEIEKQYHDAKTEKMQEYYEKHVGDLKELVPFKKTIREEYYKRAFTDKKLEQGYLDFFAHIREDLSALDELPERFRDKAALKYMESFSLSDALREGKRLEELEKLMQERKRKQETAQPTQAHQEPKQTKQDQKKPEQATYQSEEVMRLDFRVWGTREQLMGLRQYMIDHNIKFGKVE